MLKEKTVFKGTVSTILYGPDGEVKERRVFPNLVVSSGLVWVMSRLAGNGPAIMSHMAVGTGDTPTAPTDTALVSEISRVAFTSASATGNTISYTTTYGAGVGTGALKEAGIFNAASAGTMLCRTIFPVINKGVGDTLQITWAVTAS